MSSVTWLVSSYVLQLRSVATVTAGAPPWSWCKLNADGLYSAHGLHIGMNSSSLTAILSIMQRAFQVIVIRMLNCLSFHWSIGFFSVWACIKYMALNFFLISRTLQAAEFLLAMFKKRQVIKHYWVITKGIPNPPEGINISGFWSITCCHWN